MEFKTNKKALAAAVKALSGVVERKTTAPILSHLKLTAKGDKLTIEATDMDIHAIKVVDADIKTEGEIAVQAEIFSNIVAKSISDEINLKLKGDFVHVQSGRSRFKVSALSADDFPSLDDHNFDHEMNVTSKELIDLIIMTSFSASREEMRYHLSGIYLHQHGQNLRSVATDGHRLAIYDIALPEGGEGMTGVIIPLKTLSVISKFAAIGASELKVYISNRKIKVQSESATIVSKLVDGQFPDYERIIPTENDLDYIVDTEELRATIDRVSVVSDPKRNSVKISAKDGAFLVSCSGIDGINADESFEVEGDSECSIAYNKNYIYEALSHVQSDKCGISISSCGKRATVIKDANIGNSTFLVMPMRG